IVDDIGREEEVGCEEEENEYYVTERMEEDDEARQEYNDVNRDEEEYEEEEKWDYEYREMEQEELLEEGEDHEINGDEAEEYEDGLEEYDEDANEYNDESSEYEMDEESKEDCLLLLRTTPDNLPMDKRIDMFVERYSSRNLMSSVGFSPPLMSDDTITGDQILDVQGEVEIDDWNMHIDPIRDPSNSENIEYLGLPPELLKKLFTKIHSSDISKFERINSKMCAFAVEEIANRKWKDDTAEIHIIRNRLGHSILIFPCDPEKGKTRIMTIGRRSREVEDSYVWTEMIPDYLQEWASPGQREKCHPVPS
ncbi:hypothetical protein PFISCL1PPCAC_26604, partial [Pristionchus fissidentatus]